MNNFNLQIGAYGWLHSHWNATFYPDDLPEDWRLAYYSNEFNVVMVPQQYWRQDKGYDCENWLDDIHDEFRFYLECPALALSDDKNYSVFLQQIKFMRSHLAGIVIGKELMAEKFREKIQALTKQTRLYSKYSYPGLDMQTLWQQGSEQPAQLAILNDELTRLRETRVAIGPFVERLAENADAQQRSIIINHAALNAADLIKFRAVIEIMGL